jgi:uncharacterized protein YndB with AHSA1/START domain
METRTKPVTVEQTFHASADRVWQALTDNRKMKQWYFDMPAFKAEPGFEFQFYGSKGDKKYLHLCKVIEVIPERKLVHTWKYKDYPGNSMVSFELFPEGKQTMVRVTHEGLETFPQDNGDFAAENFTGGWTAILGKSLKNFLESE